MCACYGGLPCGAGLCVLLPAIVIHTVSMTPIMFSNMTSSISSVRNSVISSVVCFGLNLVDVKRRCTMAS